MKNNNQSKKSSKLRRITVGTVGGFVLLAGIIMIPYPGQGWLTVFAGLAILSTEFEWAARLLKYARGRYDDWQQWLTKQHWTVRAIFWLLTALVVVVTLWLLNTYGFINSWLDLGWDWLNSPLFT